MCNVWLLRGPNTGITTISFDVYSSVAELPFPSFLTRFIRLEGINMSEEA
jgi:hypothetical protein